MNEAEHLILDAGQRPTASRVAVLNILANASNALTHTEILDQLDNFDRVTLYRVLDWLVDGGLAHAIMGQDRARRFQLTQKNTAHQHAHFKCNQCGKVYCLDGVHIKPPQQIPKHFTVESVELNISGRCADCDSHKS
ncbi:Fur family transcriptional regulator [Methylovorus sp. MM2]|uniref:Fur family transcriptional regulator n=1 Tax=Methylovorus sp. MM2 TaxID=1848038 RepID=UPI0007E16737|nr:Fur family transcriptional regulator [Methylovorus sp. MM2]OAM53182.1 Fur family transcriptional regulator [Methylovorus sp. MM2]